MTTLTFRPRTREDDERLLEIYLQSEMVFRFSLETWRYYMDERARREGKKPVMTVGEVNGRTIGDWNVEPHYSGAAGVFIAAVEVDQSETGKGYGSALWADAEKYLREQGATKIYHSLPDDQERSQKFAADRGFEKTGRAERISRLELGSANLNGYDGVEAKLADKGIVIRTVGELPTEDESFMHEMYEAITAMVRDIPRSEETWNPDPYEIWRENFMKWPGTVPEAYFVAIRDDHPVGIANLQKNAEALFNGLTGVVPAERHKGIARALKYRTIQWARDNGFEYIDTANDAANAPMLSINIPLGYKALPAREEWLKEYRAAERAAG